MLDKIARSSAVCFGIVVVACAGGESDRVPACVPGEQKACACPSAGQGVQVCNADGTFDACQGCGGTGGNSGWPGSGGAGAVGGVGGAPIAGTGGVSGVGAAGAGGSGGASCVSQCTNQIQDCGETGIDCGGPCPACGYTLADCLAAARNGSEICDDDGWQVESPGKPLVLVCLEPANGGITYVAGNTGPVMTDGVARCQGWEQNGQNAWDYLDYIYKLDCESEQLTLDVDLSDRVGATVWVGAHDDPAGGGHFTQSCLAWKK